MNSLDTHDLFAQGRELALPATLEVCLAETPEKVDTLTLLQTFRVLPGKRVVALARWKDDLAVVKIFIARSRWEQHVQREVEGIGLLLEAGLPTPALLGSGQCLDGDSGFVLLEYLAESESVRARWERGDDGARAALLRDVITLIARCHAHGLLQKDLHLDNFLLQGDALALLDAAALEQHAGDAEGVDNVNSLRNLALFFAQFPLSNDPAVPALYEHYRALRPGAQISADAGVLDALLHKKRMARLKLVLQKLFRETSAHVCQQDFARFLVRRRELCTPEWERFIADPDAAMAGGEMLKNGNSSTVVKLRIDGRDVVVKRYNLKTWWHVLKRLFMPTRAAHSWRNAHMLELLGIATPLPLLLLERRCGVLRREAWYVAEHVAGADVQALLLQTPVEAPQWQALLAQFQTLFSALRAYGIVHGDTKLTNFLLADGVLQVLDLDAMRQESDVRRLRRASARDLARFVRNFAPGTAQYHAVQAMLSDLLQDTEHDIQSQDKGA
jgi:tRNA A-37 threonylcarbamoyl transferase component Bud32